LHTCFGGLLREKARLDRIGTKVRRVGRDLLEKASESPLRRSGRRVHVACRLTEDVTGTRWVESRSESFSAPCSFFSWTRSRGATQTVQRPLHAGSESAESSLGRSLATSRSLGTTSRVRCRGTAGCIRSLRRPCNDCPKYIQSCGTQSEQ